MAAAWTDLLAAYSDQLALFLSSPGAWVDRDLRRAHVGEPYPRPLRHLYP
jgi:hypothetical protein